MLLGFMKKFAPYVEEGSKTHTIRARRMLRPKPGDTCHCYTGLRQKGARLLGRFPLVKLQDVRITAGAVRSGLNPPPLRIWIDGVLLSPDEAEVFMFRDGFRTGRHPNYPYMTEARLHWRKKLDGEPFEGDLIHWAFVKGTNTI